MVTLIQTTKELINHREAHRSSVGFVPTMGNLHQGHLSLLKRALTDYQTVYFSIFVNPKQFGPNEDFNRYPRTLEDDLKLIKHLAQDYPDSQVVVYSPIDPSEVFPLNDKKNISVCNLSTDLEGHLRPGHFDGVSTVVHRLFELIRPDAAYFGLKDYQQYLVIKQMVKDLMLPIKIVGMPIIRETSGLALSSRNQYLDANQKISSEILYKTLTELKDLIKNKKSQIPFALDLIKEKLKDKNWDYLEIRDAENFSKNTNFSRSVTILAVYRMGQTRLLDNMQVEVQ